jgi:2'-5' RNA ligase
MRTFVAVDLHNTEKIIDIQNMIVKKHCFNINHIRPIHKDNLHITLKFLGDVIDDQVKEIITILQNLRFESFEARFTDIGCFPNSIDPRIIWLKLDNECIKQINGLYHIVIKLLNTVKDIRIEPPDSTGDEKFEFNPHLTIFRVKRHQRFEKPLNFAHDSISYNTEIDQIKLKKSILTPGGPIYSDLITIEATSRT